MLVVHLRKFHIVLQGQYGFLLCLHESREFRVDKAYHYHEPNRNNGSENVTNIDSSRTWWRELLKRSTTIGLNRID